MLEAAEQAVAFARGRHRADLDSDRMLAFALVRCIEIIGEAASRIGSAAQAEFVDIPWKEIVRMRNRLIHAYFDVDLDRL